MIYTVKPGDMISVLAVRFKTTIRILMSDNPFIPPSQLLKPGWKLQVFTPEENAIRYAATAYEHIEKAHQIKDTLKINDHYLQKTEFVSEYKNRPVLPGQIAYGRIVKETNLTEITANGFVKKIRPLSPGTLVNIYGFAVHEEQPLYLVDSNYWVVANPLYTEYDEIPQYERDGTFRLQRRRGRALTIASGVSSLASVKATANANKIKPVSYIGIGAKATSSGTIGKSSMPAFERPGYKRPILVMKNASGSSYRVEMRVLGVAASYNNNISPTPTNGGWAINIGPSGLPTLTISGYLLETKGMNEFEDFMSKYHQFLKSSKVGDYYSMGISTFYYKRTEYKGVVTSFGYTDREEEALHRKYSMQFLILKEKTLSTLEAKALTPKVSRGKLSEKDFRSDIASMLANTVTGTKNTDFY